MHNLIHKTKTYFERKKAFKTASFVLENGKYKIEKNCFCLSDSNKSCIKIESNEKYYYLLKEGLFKVTPYKFLFMNNEIVFSFVRGKQRFDNIINNINLYKNKLLYKTMDCSFDSSKSLMISNIVCGNQYDDDNHMWLFIDYYLDSINSSFIEVKLMNMSGRDVNILHYPQHGDCHSKNIFWKDNLPTLIDLDDVDNYPLFYDIFYYVIASKHEDAFQLFKSKIFDEKIRKFCCINKFDNDVDVIDLYLGAYVYFWVNKMNKKMEFHEINFYLKWFERANLSSYPTVLAAMEKYYINLKRMRIKNEKC